MEDYDLLQQINLLRYHQLLLIDMLEKSNDNFYKLVIKRKLTEDDVREFYQLCEELSKLLEEQKAEGFIHFHPLYHQFSDMLHMSLTTQEVIPACLSQNLFTPLMEELRKYL